MEKVAKPKRSVRQIIVNFFKETFRAREKSDYKEFFTRGMRGHSGTPKAEYGWMYVRVFVLLFALFALTAFLIAVTVNGIAVPTLYLLGAAFMNLTVAVFIYELNPERNLSFVLFILIMIVGTAVADLISMVGYYFCNPEDIWLSTLWTAFLEEAAKAIPTIVILLFFKKRSPMLGFIIGAAVGAGLSITEDMGYIYAYSYGVYGMVETALGRAWTAVCTHTLWTAAVGWAFCKFRSRPYDPRFIVVFLSSMALHFVWDMPVHNIFPVLFTALSAIAAVVFSFIIVKKERKPYKEVGAGDVQLVIPIAEDKLSAGLKYSKWCSHTANLVAAISAVLAGVLAIVFCLVPVDRVEVNKRFKTEEEFLQFVQGDKNFIADWDKQFDYNMPASEIHNCIKLGDEYLYAQITVKEADGYDYDYVFDFSEDEEGQSVAKVSSISVNISEEEWYWIEQIQKANSEQEEYISYARINALECYLDENTQEYVAVTDWYDDFTAAYVVSSAAGVVLLIGAVVFTVFKIKSKKSRRKENVG